MGKSRNGCGWECCPEGIVELVKNYRYSRWAYRIGFWEYWTWELSHHLPPRYGRKIRHYWENRPTQGKDN